ncbi:MAG: sigma-54-dependent Fis family transcriptional regulator [Spartobacteria bacterium]|nr:sigma-54-dependent Fis family transcriptional regulator [Spartobacteria bacterium]
MKHLLIVDDERGTRESLKLIFSKDYTLSLATNAKEAMDILQANRVDLVMLDIMMPDKDGIATLRDIQDIYPDMPVIMVSALTDISKVVEAVRDGAYDYITKPFEIDEVRQTVERALASNALQRRVEVLEKEVADTFPLRRIIGDSPAFRQALADARQAADADATVLICGESGTGKELLARMLHDMSNRRNEPFVAVHCAALPESLMESELFGHEKGAFTSADQRKLGRFDLAGSGTLFFDEVSEMSTTTQVKLLRVLQEREFMRIGGTHIIRTNARIVAAASKDLRREADEGRFRPDLYYRLGVIPITLPPLRERDGDIPLLIQHFLGVFRKSLNTPTRDFTPEAMELMCGYAWPGNIRELRNIVERMLVLHTREEYIRPEFLPAEFHTLRKETTFHTTAAGTSLEHAVNAFERDLVTKALQEANGVQTRAAEILGTTRRILRYRMEKLGIATEEVASG